MGALKVRTFFTMYNIIADDVMSCRFSVVMARMVYWANLRTAVIFERGLTGKGSFTILPWRGN